MAINNIEFVDTPTFTVLSRNNPAVAVRLRFGRGSVTVRSRFGYGSVAVRLRSTARNRN